MLGTGQTVGDLVVSLLNGSERLPQLGSFLALRHLHFRGGLVFEFRHNVVDVFQLLIVHVLA